MKKAKIAVSFVFLLCAAGIYAQKSVIKELSGTVELARPGTSSFVPARAGDEISLDTIVSTGFKSTALIEAGSTVISVRPLTRLSLKEISVRAGTETINVSLQTGRVRVDVNPPSGTRAAMTITGPSATASVRGTSFEFDTRNITVRQGTVAFQGRRGGVTLVNAGNSSSIREDGKTVDPMISGAVELEPPAPAGSDSGIKREVISNIASPTDFSIVLNIK